MYYRVLAETSQFPYPVEKFVSYAVQGFVEELREQLSVIRAQQHMVTWNNFVHQSFSGRTGRPAHRQRDLVLALPVNGAPVNQVRRLTPELAEQYAGKQQKTLSRDLNALEKLGLVERKGATIRPRIEILSAFLPLCHNDTTGGEGIPS